VTGSGTRRSWIRGFEIVGTSLYRRRELLHGFNTKLWAIIIRLQGSLAIFSASFPPYQELMILLVIFVIRLPHILLFQRLMHRW